MTNFLLSIVAALFYSVASARLYVSLGRVRPASTPAARGPSPRPFREVAAIGPAGLAGEPSASFGTGGDARRGGGRSGASPGTATVPGPASGPLPGPLPGVGAAPGAGTAAGRAGRGASNRRLTLSLAGIGLLLHSWVALSLTGLPDALRLPLFTALAVTATGVVLLQLALCLRQPADYLGLVIYPLAAVALLAGQASGEGQAVNGGAIELHILLSVLAYAVLTLAAAQAGLVAVQRRFLSRHRPGGFMRSLPPLETTERLLFALLSSGFALLTLSLASGFFYLEDMFAQHLVHKTVLACAAWTIFGVLLFGRWRFGWRGRRVVHWTLGGFGVLILAYFGSKLVLEMILQRT